MNFSKDFLKMSKYQMSSKSVRQAPVIPCGRPDGHMTKVTVAFRNFVNAPRNTWKCIYFTKKYTNGLKCTPYERRIKIITIISNNSWDVYLTNKKQIYLLIQSQQSSHSHNYKQQYLGNFPLNTLNSLHGNLSTDW